MFSTLVSVVKSIISVCLVIANLIAPGIFASSTESNAPLDSKNCLLNFAAISDSHIETDDHNTAEMVESLFDIVYTDMGNAESKLDAVLITGDVTDNGTEKQWQHARDIMKNYSPADNIILAVGNHDVWVEEDGKGLSKKNFTKYASEISGKKIKNVYYSTKINGYYFIVIGSEKDYSDEAYFSKTQLDWLASEMQKAAKTKLPVFVISHWPMNKTHGLPVTWGEEEYVDKTGGMGEQNEKVKKILNKYKNVFLFSGHIHSGFSNATMKNSNGYETIEQYGNITSVNLPSLSAISPNGHFMLGTGYNVEVYKDEIVFRARSYAAGCWLPGYNYTFKLK